MKINIKEYNLNLKLNFEGQAANVSEKLNIEDSMQYVITTKEGILYMNVMPNKLNYTLKGVVKDFVSEMRQPINTDDMSEPAKYFLKDSEKSKIKTQYLNDDKIALTLIISRSSIDLQAITIKNKHIVSLITNIQTMNKKNEGDIFSNPIIDRMVSSLS